MRKLFVLLFILCSFAGISQLSAVYVRELSKFTSSDFLSSPDGGYIRILKGEVPENKKAKSWTEYRYAISFVKFDKNLKVVNETKLSSSSGMSNGRYSELKKIGSKYWLFYLEPGVDYKIGNINAVEIDPITLSQKGSKTIVASTTIDQSVSKSQAWNMRFMSGTSPKGNYSFVYIQFSEDEFFLTCFDENFNTKWVRKEKMMKDLKKGGTCSMAIDDFGYLYMGEQHEKGSLFFSVYSPSGQSMRKEVTLPTGHANDILFQPMDNTDQVFISGSYSKSDHPTGIYTGLVSTKGVLSKIVKTEFPKDIIESLEKNDFASTKEKKYGIYGSIITKPVQHADGTRAILLEPYRMTQPPRQQLVTGSLIYVNLKAEPSFSIIPKHSRSADITDYDFNSSYENGSVYYAYEYHSKMIIFYSDNPENMKRDLTQASKIVTPLNEELAAAIIDTDGSVKRQLIQTTTLSSLKANGMEVQDGTVLIPVPYETYKSREKEFVAIVKL